MEGCSGGYASLEWSLEMEEMRVNGGSGGRIWRIRRIEKRRDGEEAREPNLMVEGGRKHTPV
jgi:hypothetical protein